MSKEIAEHFVHKYWVAIAENNHSGNPAYRGFLVKMVNAALEHQDKRISELEAENDKLRAEIKVVEALSDFRFDENSALKAENERLREALEKMDKIIFIHDDNFVKVELIYIELQKALRGEEVK